MADMCRKGLHEMTADNTYVEPKRGARRCRACQRDYNRAWREANRERIRERQRDYREDHPERILKSNRAYREANRETIRERGRTYAQVRYATDADHREAARRAARERRAANRKPQPTTITIPASLEDAVKRLGGEA